ncbi:hypothetical protein GEMRC1_012168 [Eukaryota sp. GEM-RC1]
MKTLYKLDNFRVPYLPQQLIGVQPVESSDVDATDRLIFTTIASTIQGDPSRQVRAVAVRLLSSIKDVENSIPVLLLERTRDVDVGVQLAALETLKVVVNPNGPLLLWIFEQNPLEASPLVLSLYSKKSSRTQSKLIDELFIDYLLNDRFSSCDEALSLLKVDEYLQVFDSVLSSNILELMT